MISDLVRDARMSLMTPLIKIGYRSLLIYPYQSPIEDGVIYLVDPVPRNARLEDDLVCYSFFSNLLPLALWHLENPVVTPMEYQEERE